MAEGSLKMVEFGVQMVALVTGRGECIVLDLSVRSVQGHIKMFIGSPIHTLWCVHVRTVRRLWRNTSRRFVEG